MEAETAKRDKAAAKWLEQVAHYHRGTLTIDTLGSEGGSAAVTVDLDGNVRAAESGRLVAVDSNA